MKTPKSDAQKKPTYKCCVCQITSKENKKLTFHALPKFQPTKKRWLKSLTALGEISDGVLICSKHFKKDDFVVKTLSNKLNVPNATYDSKNNAGELRELKKSVFPTVDMPQQTIKIKIKTEEKGKMPKKEVVVVRPRHQSRRAASKEALKQMQILLDDEDDDDPVEIPDDDDEVIPLSVVVSPPKKKYKLTHRKSSDGNDRDVIVLKSITPSITNHYVENNLELECWTEELEPCQKTRNKTIQEEEKQLQAKLDQLIKSCNAEIIYKGDLTTAVEVREQIQKTIAGVKSAPAPASNIILNNSIGNPGGYQLVMDPRLGLIVGAVQSTQPQQVAQPPPATPPTPASKQFGKVQVATNLQAPPPPASGRRGRRSKNTPQNNQPTPSPPPPSRSVLALKRGAAMQPAPPTPPITRATRGQAPSALTKPAPVITKPVAAPKPAPKPATVSPASNLKPTETNVEGGLSTSGSAPKTIDLTSDDGRPLPDSREIAFNKLQGKTFPSLVVVARPHLRVVDGNADRPKLDAKVKAVLMHAPTKFTEWLIQQGLVRSEQRCSIHTSTQLKLGMYSDVSKFPYSGGYVWISECCPQRFVSVFSGSLFEGSPHPPLVILKLLYHWACQTNIQNVTQWVKVDNLYVKGMFTWLRSICTVALQTHIRQLGGANTKVEVGVISLGTTSQDGNSRQVKVEVLGVLEAGSKLLRLRAVEPLADGDRNYKKRFSKILEPLVQWVHPSSTIVTDLTVDKATLHQMGFAHVLQSTSNDNTNSNRTIMEYLRRIVPRMFQNTLSLLSRQIIQQFLDELVWREWFGTTSLQSFDNLVIHLSEQTRFESNTSLIVRLNRVALNPFKNWAIPTNTVPSKVVVDNTKKRKRKETTETPTKVTQTVSVEVNRPPKSTSPDVPEQMVPLENYYYGTIDNYPPKTNVTLNMKCPFCKETFNNNIVLMNHLFKHAHNVSKDGQMCRYCLTSVPTANDLLKHIATSHPAETKFDNGFVCLVCETQYMNPFVLGKHMSKEHVPSELPYQCGTCAYRCSNHKQAIDHFYKQHDNGPTIQCPFCLKSTTVFSSSRNIVQNMNYFIQHLQKHQRKQFARRCGKCNLWFVQKDVLKDHQTRMHASQRGKQGLVPWLAPRNGVMVPKSRMDKYPCDAEVINFGTLYFNVNKSLLCKECNEPMDTPKHFPSFESCQNPNCQYSTCCTNAMQEHNARCSKNPVPTVSDEKLPYEMFCVCGYSSTDGNQMARHLAICERKSAYPSLSGAKGASVTHSMLDVLGLVRKPGETERRPQTATKSEPFTSEYRDPDAIEPRKTVKFAEKEKSPVMNSKPVSPEPLDDIPKEDGIFKPSESPVSMETEQDTEDPPVIMETEQSVEESSKDEASKSPTPEAESVCRVAEDIAAKTSNQESVSSDKPSAIEEETENKEAEETTEVTSKSEENESIEAEETTEITSKSDEAGEELPAENESNVEASEANAVPDEDTAVFEAKDNVDEASVGEDNENIDESSQASSLQNNDTISNEEAEQVKESSKASPDAEEITPSSNVEAEESNIEETANDDDAVSNKETEQVEESASPKASLDAEEITPSSNEDTAFSEARDNVDEASVREENEESNLEEPANEKAAVPGEESPNREAVPDEELQRASVPQNAVNDEAQFSGGEDESRSSLTQMIEEKISALSGEDEGTISLTRSEPESMEIGDIPSDASASAVGEATPMETD